MRPSIILAALALPALASTGASQQPARWTVAPSPALTIGEADEMPEGLLQVIVFATRLADGSVMVGDRGEHALKLYDSKGRFVRAYARKGSGPGEVRYHGKMFRCGDSLLTYDIEEGHRMSVFTLDGRYHRVFRWKGLPGQQTPYASACNAAGRFAHLGWESERSMKPGVFRSLAPVWLSHADAGEPQEIDSVPGSERWGMAREGRMTGTRPLPLGKEPQIAIGRSRIYVGSADEFALRVYDLNGRRTGEIRRPGAPEATTRADIREFTERDIANEGEQFRARLERAYAEIEFPRTLPAYTSLVVDADDHLWVRAFPRGTGGTVAWSVFSPAGALVAEVAVPKHLEVFEIGRDYVLGRYLDPTEAVPLVRLYRLARTRAP